MYYKQVNNGFIVSVGRTQSATTGVEEITKENYNALIQKIKSKLEDTVEVVYELSAETETYITRETTHEEKVQWYLNKVNSDEMTINEVNEEFRKEVEEKLPTPKDESNIYGVSDEIYHAIIDDYTMELLGGEQ